MSAKVNDLGLRQRLEVWPVNALNLQPRSPMSIASTFASRCVLTFADGFPAYPRHFLAVMHRVGIGFSRKQLPACAAMHVVSICAPFGVVLIIASMPASLRIASSPMRPRSHILLRSAAFVARTRKAGYYLELPGAFHRVSGGLEKRGVFLGSPSSSSTCPASPSVRTGRAETVSASKKEPLSD